MPSGLVGDWWRPFWAADDVCVVHVDLVPDVVNERHAWSWLDAAERQRAGRFRHDVDRRRFVLCRAAARSILCSSLPCQNRQLVLRAAKHGKPFAAVGGRKSAVGFNVSHSGQHGLIALARDAQLGVDVEERVPRGNLDILIDAVLGPNERAEVMAVTGARKLRLFLDLWTMKEALSKAHGMGLSMDVSGFEVSKGMRRGSSSGVFRFLESPEVTWRLKNLGTDQFAAAVAYRTDAPGGA